MVTISRIRTKRFFGASIRWKILLAFFVIVGISFAVAATNLTGLVRDYLFEQKTHEDSLLTEKAAAAAAPFFDEADTENISRILGENARSMDGRLMLILCRYSEDDNQCAKETYRVRLAEGQIEKAVGHLTDQSHIYTERPLNVNDGAIDVSLWPNSFIAIEV